jgi:hypothetical protein
MLESVALIRIGYEPGVAGNPEITPLEERDKPGGNGPVTSAQA